MMIYTLISIRKYVSVSLLYCCSNTFQYSTTVHYAGALPKDIAREYNTYVLSKVPGALHTNLTLLTTNDAERKVCNDSWQVWLNPAHCVLSAQP
jgi:hypothetical protein